MAAQRWRSTKGLLFCLPFALLAGCSSRPFDEFALRREFSLPWSASLIHYSASPSTPGWFGREGLKISMVFKLKPDDFDTLLLSSRASGQWKSLPIPEATLMHLAAIQSSRIARTTLWKATGSPIPETGSLANPTDQQRLNQWKQFLEPLPRSGWYQIKTSGDDILRNPKEIQTILNYDVNDFILAILNPEERTISFRISSNY